MADFLQSWIATTIKRELEEALTWLQHRTGRENQKHSFEKDKLFIHLKQPQYVQVIKFNPSKEHHWDVSLSDGFSQILASFQREAIRALEEKRATKFERTEGGLLGIAEFSVILDLKAKPSKKLRFHVENFLLKGGEGSQVFKHPIAIEKQIEKQREMKSLIARIESIISSPAEGIPFSSIASPILSQPSFSNNNSSQVLQTSSSHFMTQLPTHAIESRIPKKNGILNTMGAVPTRKTLVEGHSRGETRAMSTQNSSTSSILQPFSEKRMAESTAILDAKANELQSPQFRKSSPGHDLSQPQSPTKSVVSNDSEKENSQESVKNRAHRPLIGKSKPVPAAVASGKETESGPVIHPFMDENIFEGLTRIPRRDVRIPKDQQKLLNGKNAWEHSRNDGGLYANIPPANMENLISHYENTASLRGSRDNTYQARMVQSNILKSTTNHTERQDIEERDDNEQSSESESADEDNDRIEHELPVEGQSHPPKHHSVSKVDSTLRKVSKAPRNSTPTPRYRKASQAIDDESEGEQATSWPTSPVRDPRDVEHSGPGPDMILPALYHRYATKSQSSAISNLDDHTPRAVPRPSIPMHVDADASSIKDEDSMEDATKAMKELPAFIEHHQAPKLPPNNRPVAPFLPPSSSSGIQDELEMTTLHAVGDPVEEASNLDMNEAQGYSQGTQAPPCGQFTPSTAQTGQSLVQVERTPNLVPGNGRGRSTGLLSSQPVIPGTFNDTIGRPSHGTSSNPDQNLNRGFSPVQEDSVQRPHKPQKPGYNLDILGFSQEHEHQDVKEMVKRRRRQFKEQEEAKSRNLENRQPTEQEDDGDDKISTLGNVDTHARQIPAENPEHPLASPSVHDEVCLVENNTEVHASQPPAEDQEKDQEDQEHPTSSTSVYDVYKSAYPSYTGSQNSFLKVLVYLEWLLSCKRAPPQFTWDDFIRAFNCEYMDHTEECQIMAKASSSYIDFYNNEIEDLEFSKKVVTSENLQNAIAMDLGKAEEFRKSFHRKSKSISSESVPNGDNMDLTLQSPMEMQAFDDSNGLHAVEGKPGNNRFETEHSRNVLEGATKSRINLEPIANDLDLDNRNGSPEVRKSIERDDASSEAESEALDVPPRVPSVTKSYIGRILFFENTSQLKSVTKTNDTTAASEVDESGLDNVSNNTLMTKTPRRLPWVQDKTPPTHSKSIDVRHSSKISIVPKTSSHAKMKTARPVSELKSTPQKTSLQHSFGSPILGARDDSPIAQTRTISNTSFASTSRQKDSLQAPKSVASTSKAESVHRVEEWRREVSAEAENTMKSGPKIVRKRKSIPERLNAFSIEKINQHYTCKRRRKSGKYSGLPT